MQLRRPSNPIWNHTLSCPITMKWSIVVLTFIVLIASVPKGGDARRGRGRKQSKGGIGNINMPIGGKWRDPDTAKYYDNPDRAKITKYSHFDLEYTLGHKITFICEAKGLPRPTITWFKEGIEIFAHKNLQLHEWPSHLNQIKSKMEIDPATQMDAGIYECYAENKYSVDKRTFRTDFVTIFD